MSMEIVPLVLGGHSFIRQLGNDPALNAGQCAELVAACLDCGITWFDILLKGHSRRIHHQHRQFRHFHAEPQHVAGHSAQAFARE